MPNGGRLVLVTKWGGTVGGQTWWVGDGPCDPHCSPALHSTAHCREARLDCLPQMGNTNMFRILLNIYRTNLPAFILMGKQDNDYNYAYYRTM